MLLEAPLPAKLESGGRPYHGIDLTVDGAHSEGDFAAGGRRRASDIGRRGDFATGTSTRTASATRTTGDFATGRRTRGHASAVGDFATGMRTAR